MLSNLDIIENISLIQEYHQKKSKNLAQSEAMQMLQKISLQAIARKRVDQLNKEEIFYAMLVRASMVDCSKIFIHYLFTINDECNDMKNLYKNILSLELKQDIIFIDVRQNITHYEGLKCNMIE